MVKEGVYSFSKEVYLLRYKMGGTHRGPGANETALDSRGW